ncbi:MAG TPA: hypothetical protein VGF17_23520, partial [Phytomonospora sp.]
MSATVVVIGGGYGGTALAKALDEHADVFLVDPKDAFVHSAGALRALVDPDWAPNMFFPYDTLLDPAEQLLPAFAPGMRDDLHRQLAGLGVTLRLGTSLTEQPPSDPGRAETFTVATTTGEVTADIW